MSHKYLSPKDCMGSAQKKLLPVSTYDNQRELENITAELSLNCDAIVIRKVVFDEPKTMLISKKDFDKIVHWYLHRQDITRKKGNLHLPVKSKIVQCPNGNGKKTCKVYENHRCEHAGPHGKCVSCVPNLEICKACKPVKKGK